MGLVPAPLGPIPSGSPGPLRYPIGRPPGRGIPETIVLAINGAIKAAIQGAIQGATKGAIAVPPLVPVRPGLKAIPTIAPEGSIGSPPEGPTVAPAGLVPGSLAGEPIAPRILKVAAAATPVPVIPLVIGEQFILEGAQGVLQALEGAARLGAPLTTEAAIETVEGLLQFAHRHLELGQVAGG